MTDQYAVIGNPISHSQSPRIHTMFANQTNQDMHYTKLLCDVDEFDQTVQNFIQRGGRGLNVTLPFKQNAFRIATSLSLNAQRTGAVNTLIVKDKQLHGDNTDGVGLVRDLSNNLKLSLAAARILVLGAGGAVRGILPNLIDQQPASLTIANRTESKAHELAALFAELFPIQACHFRQLAGSQFDIIINGTSASVDNDLPPLADGVLQPQGVCYDLMYADSPTPFVRWGLEQEASLSADGIGMLVEQAAESFYLWRGVRPETDIVIDTLKPDRLDLAQGIT